MTGLKDQAYREQPATLSHFKDSIIRHVLGINEDLLRSAVENNVLRMERVVEKHGTRRNYEESFVALQRHLSATFCAIFSNKFRAHDLECLSSKFHVVMTHTRSARPSESEKFNFDNLVYKKVERKRHSVL
ncbi:hypothetical protein AVEN_222984-1 [Araneus ventricosus]|uniref:Uncharacterized protein n=1 Tax=Araneus ventricosus TaxID=182803 RepID=A0A4Y2K8X3_ARAVE|nr:hypothetical protein AVEN_222984-1 [Araneus ventricosus]